MSEPVALSIADQLNRLKSKILSFNKKGDLYGLFSNHILANIKDFGEGWAVVCNDKKWLDNEFKADNLYDISKLGYSIHLNDKGYSRALEVFRESLNTLQKRNHFNGSHVSFPYHPITFLGLVLGTKHVEDPKRKEDYLSWLKSILKERRKRGKISTYHTLFYNYIESELENKKLSFNIQGNNSSLEELSFIEWGFSKGHFIISDPDNYLINVQYKILSLLVQSSISQVEDEQAPLIWAAANNAVAGGINKLIRTPSHLIVILQKFESALKRWRYDDDSVKNPIRWPINNEKEVQDILWLILRPYFDDLIDEETMPKFGHSSYKPDFAIPSLKIFIEAKYVKKKADFKAIEKEIMQDSIGYLSNTSNYEKILVFIYDHSCSAQEHDETKRALKKVSGIEDVIIVSRPSQLPS